MSAWRRTVARQHSFFDAFVYTPVSVFCILIEKHAASRFYRAAAKLVRVFIAIEREAFDLETPE